VPRVAGLLSLWVASGAILSALAAHVRDWFVMTDELLYERFAISVAQSGSPLPRLHGELVPSLSQLYPLLIAPFFRDGSVPQDIHGARIAGAWVMSSACIPAFLLARRVTRRTAIAYLAAALAVWMPWILYSSFLLTEVAAYPAFLWCVLALQRALSEPSTGNDALAVLGLALAYFARTQLALLVVVLPVAALLVDRRAVVARHRLLAAAYSVLVISAIALIALGRFSSLFGVYGNTVGSDVLPHGVGRWLLEHAALLALGLGIVPFVVGVAWLLANAVRAPLDQDSRVFAALGALIVPALIVQVTIYDLHVGAEAVFDRYLFYAAPLVVIAFLRALLDERPLRWWLVVPAAVVCAGFAVGAPPAFMWSQFPTITPDSPVSSFFRPLTSALHGVTATQAVLAAGTAVAAVAFALAPRRLLVLAGAFLLVLPIGAAYSFHRLFAVNGWSLRPVTASEHDQAWIDRVVGSKPTVTMVPYPISSNYFSSQQRWRDVEFWNKSAAHDAQVPGEGFLYTGTTFPKLDFGYDPATGATSTSPTRYVAMSDKETRFRVSGPAIGSGQDVLLIDAGPRWRLDWATFGLYDDGWTKEHVVARVRVFPGPGQRVARLRTLTLAARAPDNIPERVVTATSNAGRWQATTTNTATVTGSLPVCVPPHGWTEVRIRTPDASWALGSIDTLSHSFTSRRVGVAIGEIALADEIGGPCRP
jgi:hypothetical protein